MGVCSGLLPCAKKMLWDAHAPCLSAAAKHALLDHVSLLCVLCHLCVFPAGLDSFAALSVC
jgi:hypothetical protein